MEHKIDQILVNQIVIMDCLARLLSAPGVYPFDCHEKIRAVEANTKMLLPARKLSNHD